MKKGRLGKYIPSTIEQKWQEKWQTEGVYKFTLQKGKDNYYNLVELPYPSGDLHLGHWFTFVNADAHARYMRMSGKNVFYPPGFDAFGLPAENAAIKRNIHPSDWTMKNIETMTKQFTTMGTMLDWDHQAITCLPEYYTWNQWIFLKLYEKGLAYRGKTLSNWCPSCQTVLANEAIEDGKCWRCGSVVQQKEIEQWFLKITDYADKLLWDNVDKKESNGVNWPRSVREGQNNWIGKSEGALVGFELSEDEKPNFVLLHGYTGSATGDFNVWIRKELESRGYTVQIPQLPDSQHPTEKGQVDHVLRHCRFDEQTILLGHSLGAAVALKVVEKLDVKIRGLVLAAGFVEPTFLDHQNRPFKDTFEWVFDFDKIKSKTGFSKIIQAVNDSVVSANQGQILSNMLDGTLFEFEAEEDHITGSKEPFVLTSLLNTIEVFTTRPDTLYGATFMVVAPEHPFVASLLRSKSKNQKENIDEVKKYVKAAKNKTEMERKEQKEKTGVFTGLYAINPVTNEEIPIWVADYVLWGYGTGAIMAVPAHDERDFAFAKTFDLPIRFVISNPAKQGEKSQAQGDLSPATPDRDDNQPYIGSGVLINSGAWNGWSMPKEIGKVIDWLEEKGIGKRKVQYHLHDWSISRQRYWGTPVPIIYCRSCWDRKAQSAKRKAKYGTDYTEIEGEAYVIHSVPLEHLPVELPYKVDYQPKGKPPLASAEGWMKVTCPECGGEAKRDPETLDTFFDSAWYYYRYVDPKFSEGPFDKLRVKELLPVDIYFGGAEHTLGHTLYARFFTKFFKDIGLVGFDEFAKKRVQHGVILGPDGYRMSKSRGNVVNPDDVVREYGADTVRLYLAFMMPFEATAPWNPSAISGVYRFLRRVWDLSEKTQSEERLALSAEDLYWMHRTVKKVGEDLRDIKFNTAVSAMMEWLNHLSRKDTVSSEEYKTLLLLLAPLAPHVTEELYQKLESGIKNHESGKEGTAHNSSFMLHDSFQSIHLQPWPTYDEQYLTSDTITIVVQVNGKVRDNVQVQSAKRKEQSAVEQIAKESEKVQKHMEGKKVVKVIYVEGKLINFVTN